MSLVLLLLEAGNVDLNLATKGGDTALHWLCMSDCPNQEEIGNLLLEFGAIANRENKSGQTPAALTSNSALLVMIEEQNEIFARARDVQLRQESQVKHSSDDPTSPQAEAKSHPVVTHTRPKAKSKQSKKLKITLKK